MKEDFHIIIPARYQSTRFVGKLLQKIGGITILERVYKQALLANPKSVVIATDNAEIFDHATGFGADVQMTSMDHQSGTDRIAEVIRVRNFDPQAIIVNVQGDEPFIAPALIKQVAASLLVSTSSMATLCWPIENVEQFNNPNTVKVVRGKNNQAMYFSRSPIPFCRDNIHAFDNAYKHIGLYAYRASFLLEFVQLPTCNLESIEALEQLRVLWAGFSIQVDEACECPKQDINTVEDLHNAYELAK